LGLAGSDSYLPSPGKVVEDELMLDDFGNAELANLMN